VGKGLKSRPFHRAERNHKWRAIVKRFGHRVEICIGPVTNDEACAWEVDNIASMGTFSTCHAHDDLVDIGCNFTKGGEGTEGRQPDDETRVKMSQSQRRRFAEQGVSDVTRQKLSNLFKGRTAPNKGRSPSEETRARMCAASSGENNRRARLTEDDVLELRREWSKTQQPKWHFCEDHAEWLGVTPEAIYGVIMGKTWKNVKHGE
jgi:hypothetical protein